MLELEDGITQQVQLEHVNRVDQLTQPLIRDSQRLLELELSISTDYKTRTRITSKMEYGTSDR